MKYPNGNKKDLTLSSSDMRRHSLRVDCENCFGFCYVALYFSASEGFPADKDAGKPCLNLQPTSHIQGELSYMLNETERLTILSPDALIALDLPAHRASVNALILQTSELVRAKVRSKRTTSSMRPKSLDRGLDLIGANLAQSILVTQAQINTAKGDSGTKIPINLSRLMHWTE